jgi:hypothetical protein
MGITRRAATLGIIFFVALALIMYFFDRVIVPEPIDRDSTALALASQIEKCTRIYGNESTRRKQAVVCVRLRTVRSASVIEYRNA